VWLLKPLGDKQTDHRIAQLEAIGGALGKFSCFEGCKSTVVFDKRINAKT